MPEEIAEASPPPLPPSPLEKLNDFSDRFSPMLVKELRQGLRTYTFVILFLILQGLLGLILLVTTAANGNAGGFVSSIIFFLFSLAALIVQPLRGMSAIASEVKGDTIDLMSLTRLSAWRIVFGKWSSIMGQTALLLFAIVPYLILRYFFGGMQLFSELLLLFSLFLLSGVFTAITVGLSASTVALVRAIPLLGALFLVVPISLFSFSEFDSLIEFFTIESATNVLALVATYLVAAYIGYFFLELAATTIAPSAENRATRKRLAALVILPLVFVALFQVNINAAWITALWLLGMLTLDLFTEDTEYPSIVLRPFVRKGPLGSLLARFLAPGWATGTVFHLFLIVLLIALDTVMGGEFSQPTNSSVVGTCLSIFGMLYFPLLLVNLFRKRATNRLVAYILFAALLFGLMPLMGLLKNIGEIETLVKVSSFIPQLQPFLPYSPNEKTFKLIAGTATGLYVAGCLFFALRPLRELGKLELTEKQRQQGEGGTSA